MRKFYFGNNGKLVRNKVLQHCLDDPLVTKTKYRTLSKKELIERLREKLCEEAEEVTKASNRSELIEELADLQEVLHEIMQHENISDDEIRVYEQKKLREKGNFADGIFIEYVVLDNKSVWNDKFEAAPDKYREEKI